MKFLLLSEKKQVNSVFFYLPCHIFKLYVFCYLCYMPALVVQLLFILLIWFMIKALDHIFLLFGKFWIISNIYVGLSMNLFHICSEIVFIKFSFVVLTFFLMIKVHLDLHTSNEKQLSLVQGYMSSFYR